MCYWILTSTALCIAKSTVIPIPDENLQSDSLKKRRIQFTNKVNDRIGNHENAVVNGETVDKDDLYHDALFLP
jgi:hypothetical protein